MKHQDATRRKSRRGAFPHLPAGDLASSGYRCRANAPGRTAVRCRVSVKVMRALISVVLVPPQWETAGMTILFGSDGA